MDNKHQPGTIVCPTVLLLNPDTARRKSESPVYLTAEVDREQTWFTQFIISTNIANCSPGTDFTGASGGFAVIRSK